MKSSRIFLLASLIPVFANSTLFAQQPAAQSQPSAISAQAIPPDQQATREQIQKFFEACHLRRQMEQLFNMLPSVMQQSFQSQVRAMNERLAPGARLMPADEAVVEKTMSKYMQKAMDVYPIDEMLEDAIPIYQRHISRADADAIIAFYTSPAGQRILDQQSSIMSEYMAVVTSHMQERTHRLTDEMTAELRQIVPAYASPSSSPQLPSK